MFDNQYHVFDEQRLQTAQEILLTKNQHHEIQQCSHYFAELMHASNESEIVGKTIYQFDAPVIEHASIFFANEIEVMATQKEKSFFGIFTYTENRIKSMILTITPIVADGIAQGVYTVGKILGENFLERLGLSTLIEKYTKLKKVINISRTFVETVYNLTIRETEVLFFLLHGDSAKQAGIHLNISNRTIETHIESIKNKLDCRSKSELFLLSHINKLIDFIPKSLFSSTDNEYLSLYNVNQSLSI